MQVKFERPVEIIVIVNGDYPEMAEFLKNTSLEKPLKFISIPRTGFGGARNRGIEISKGEILYFIDDDVTLDPNFEKHLIKSFKDPTIAVLGGPNITPSDNSLKQIYIGKVMESKFGTANMSYRYKPSGTEHFTDDKKIILCNMAVRKKILVEEKISFPSTVVCNEENILIQTIKQRGYKILYKPDFIVYHDRRGTLTGFIQQIFRYGRGRLQNILINPNSFNIIFLMPSLLILVMIFFLLTNSQILKTILLLYFLTSLFFSIFEAIRGRDFFLVIVLFFLYPILHISYGLGFIYQIIAESWSRKC